MNATPQELEYLDKTLSAESLKLFHGLRDVRIQRGLSLAYLSDQLGIGADLLEAFEAGEGDPTMADIRRYAKAVRAQLKFTVWPAEEMPPPEGQEEWFAKAAGNAHHTGGALIQVTVHWFDRQAVNTVSFAACPEDLADPERLLTVFLVPSAHVIAGQVAAKRLAQPLEADPIDGQEAV